MANIELDVVEDFEAAFFDIDGSKGDIASLPKMDLKRGVYLFSDDNNKDVVFICKSNFNKEKMNGWPLFPGRTTFIPIHRLDLINLWTEKGEQRIWYLAF